MIFFLRVKVGELGYERGYGLGQKIVGDQSRFIILTTGCGLN
jgi:hypothetical protein